MKLLRILAGLAILVCLMPLASVIVASLIATHYGCTLHEGFANPCIVAGRDIGNTLYSMGVMAWFMLVTVPAGAVILLAWIAIEIVAHFRRHPH